MSYTAEQPIQYTPDPSKFGALAGGKVWFGVPNGNPASVPGDRIQVYLARQGLADLAIAQPIDIGPGGVWYYNGSPAQIKVLVPYCVQILNSLGVQKFYAPAAGDEIAKFNEIDSILNKAITTVATYADISAALNDLEIGQQISLFSHTSVGFGGDIFDVVSSSGLYADGGTVVINGSKAAVRKYNGKQTPVLFGAKGIADANEVTYYDVCLTTNKTQDHNGAKFLLDLTSHLGALGTYPEMSADFAHIKNSNVKAIAKDYSVSSPGTIDYYSVWRHSGDNVSIFNNTFNGNNTFDYTPYQPSGSNAWCIPIEVHDSYGAKIFANSVFENGGHAIEGSVCDSLIISINYANKHNGIGATNANGLVVSSNTSSNTSDSHYFLNTCSGSVAVGNVGRTNTGGGGIDLAGTTDVVASSNVITGSKANGIWPLKSPNTGALYSRVLISSNVLYNNCNYPNNDQGEIQIGDYNNLSEYQGSDIAVIGNLVSPTDTPSGSGYNPSVWVHGNTENTAVIANVFNPDAALVSGSQPSIVDMGSKSPVYAYNVKCGLTNTFAYFSADPDDNSVFYGNVGIRIHPSSVAVPKTMRSQDGVWEYHIVRKLTKAGKSLLEISYTGGFIYDIIEITLTSRNTNGVIKRRITTQGTNGVAVTILDNTSVLSFGPNPPAITVDTATPGVLKILGNIAALGSDNEDTSLHVHILTASDSPSRFTPKFI